MNQKNYLVLLFFIIFFSCRRQDKEPQPIRHIVFVASGEIQEKINEFRTLLRPVNSTPGASQGRREINTKFFHINTKAASQYSSFRGDKAFADKNSSLWEVRFQVPGQTTPAWTKGFGAVFSNVDSSNSTTLEFFNGDKSLGQFFVPKSSGSKNLSFIGVYFPDQKITHIKVAHKGKLSNNIHDVTNGGTDDIVVLDEFI
jgi:hypothetical protein